MADGRNIPCREALCNAQFCMAAVRNQTPFSIALLPSRWLRAGSGLQLPIRQQKVEAAIFEPKVDLAIAVGYGCSVDIAC